MKSCQVRFVHDPEYKFKVGEVQPASALEHMGIVECGEPAVAKILQDGEVFYFCGKHIDFVKKFYPRGTVMPLTTIKVN